MTVKEMIELCKSAPTDREPVLQYHPDSVGGLGWVDVKGSAAMTDDRECYRWKPAEPKPMKLDMPQLTFAVRHKGEPEIVHGVSRYLLGEGSIETEYELIPAGELVKSWQWCRNRSGDANDDLIWNDFQWEGGAE